MGRAKEKSKSRDIRSRGKALTGRACLVEVREVYGERRSYEQCEPHRSEHQHESDAQADDASQSDERKRNL
jgi:hypothetical protein